MAGSPSKYFASWVVVVWWTRCSLLWKVLIFLPYLGCVLRGPGASLKKSLGNFFGNSYVKALRFVSAWLR